MIQWLIITTNVCLFWRNLKWLVGYFPKNLYFSVLYTRLNLTIGLALSHMLYSLEDGHTNCVVVLHTCTFLAQILTNYFCIISYHFRCPHTRPFQFQLLQIISNAYGTNLNGILPSSNFRHGEELQLAHLFIHTFPDVFIWQAVCILLRTEQIVHCLKIIFIDLT